MIPSRLKVAIEFGLFSGAIAPCNLALYLATILFKQLDEKSKKQVEEQVKYIKKFIHDESIEAEVWRALASPRSMPPKNFDIDFWQTREAVFSLLYSAFFVLADDELNARLEFESAVKRLLNSENCLVSTILINSFLTDKVIREFAVNNVLQRPGMTREDAEQVVRTKLDACARIPMDSLSSST